MINLQPWQKIKVNNKIAYFQFYARFNQKDHAVITFEEKTKDKIYYKYESVEIENIEYI